MITECATIEIDAEVHGRLAAWCRALDVTPDAIAEELLVDLLADYEVPPVVVPGLALIGGPHQTPKLHKRRNRTREDYEAEERIIPHDTLVKRLARDRMAIEGGDAGGAVYAAPLATPIVGPAETTRELCLVHGWVGRHRFEKDGHIHCEPQGERCAACAGRGITSTGLACKVCDGRGGIDATSDTRQPPIERNNGKVQASDHVPAITIDGQRYRNRPKRSAPRAKTIAVKRITQASLREGELLWPDIDDEQRPKTRAECVDGPRPCPWASCKHHLYLDVNPETGSIKLNFPDRELEDMTFSCALDEAEKGVHTLEALGEKTNVTRERARQIEVKAYAVMRAKAIEAGLTAEDIHNLGKDSAA